MIERHTHNGTDTPLIPGSSIQGAPQEALTVVNEDTINTGDPTSDTVIENMRTRINELETKLQTLGIIK